MSKSVDSSVESSKDHHLSSPMTDSDAEFDQALHYGDDINAQLKEASRAIDAHYAALQVLCNFERTPDR